MKTMKKILTTLFAVAFLAVFTVGAVTVPVSGSGESGLKVYDAEGAAVNRESGTAPLENGYIFATAVRPVEISAGTLEVKLGANSILQIGSLSDVNPSLTLATGSAEFAIGGLSTPMSVSTPVMTYYFFSDSTIIIVSTTGAEQAYVSGGSAIAYNKITHQRFSISDGTCRDFASTKAPSEAWELDAYRSMIFGNEVFKSQQAAQEAAAKAAEEPQPAEEPAAEPQPVSEPAPQPEPEPAVEEPAAEPEPAVEEPASEPEPAAEEPETEIEPVTEPEPVTEEPVTEEPAVEETVPAPEPEPAQPVVINLPMAQAVSSLSPAPAPALSISTVEPTAEPEPVVEEPVAEPEPAAEEPAAEEQARQLPETLTVTKSEASSDIGLNIGIWAKYAGSFSAGAKVTGYADYNTLHLSLNLFDSALYPFDLDAIKAWYLPPTTGGIFSYVRYALQFVDELRLGTLQSRFHLYLGTKENFDFAPNFFIASIDHDFDTFYPERRMTFFSSINTDKIDLTVFADDVAKNREGKLWGGGRLAYSVNKLTFGAGAYGRLNTLSPLSVELYPMIDAGMRVSSTRTFNISVGASFVYDDALSITRENLFKRFMLEGRLSLAATSGNFQLDLAGAWNRGRRFSSLINDTKSQEFYGYFEDANAIERSSIDIIARTQLKIGEHVSLYSYLDVPYEYSSKTISDSNYAGVNADVAALKLSLDFDAFSVVLNYSQLGMSTRMVDLYHALKGEYSKLQAIKNFVDSRYSDTWIGVELRFTKVISAQLRAGTLYAGDKLNPAISLLVNVDLSKQSLSK